MIRVIYTSFFYDASIGEFTLLRLNVGSERKKSHSKSQVGFPFYFCNLPRGRLQTGDFLRPRLAEAFAKPDFCPGRGILRYDSVFTPVFESKLQDCAEVSSKVVVVTGTPFSPAQVHQIFIPTGMPSSVNPERPAGFL